MDNIHSASLDHEAQSEFFKFSPKDFEYEPKSPPAPTTPIIHSKCMDFYDEFALHPAKSSSLQSDKENNDKISNKLPITHYMPCISPIGSKVHESSGDIDKKCILQLPDIKLPKTITQFELQLSSSPSQVVHKLSLSPIPLPQFTENSSIWFETDRNQSPFPIPYPSYYHSSSPYPLHWDSNCNDFNDLFAYQSASAPPILSVSVPPLVECSAKRTYFTMNDNEDYNNLNHPNKRRKISHSGEYRNGYQASYESTNTNSNTKRGEFQQYQPDISDLNTGATSMSIAESENEPILSPHKRRARQEGEDKGNNLTKRALFKEKRNLNINIHSNQTNMGSIAPDTAPNNNDVQNGESQARNDSFEGIGLSENDRTALDNVVSTAPIANNGNTNLDWFGTDENINTLNGSNHGFGDMHMFPMGMADDMKHDIGLPNFLMNDLNHNEIMEMDLHQQLPLAQSIKEENNKHNAGVLPPAVYGAAAQNTVYHPAQFSLSTSPAQQSSMFMDQINTNSAIYQQNEFANNSNVVIASRAIASGAGPNSVRPSNLPTLRRSASQPQQARNVSSSSGNLGVDFIGASKSELHSAQISNISASKSSTTHVLTPFDYPLSNPTIRAPSGADGAAAVAHDAHSYYARYISNIKQENAQKSAPIHSAPLYSISAAHNASSSTYPSSQRNSQSLSATPNPSTSHFSLSSSLLNIPQHLSTNQHSAHSSFPHAASVHNKYKDNDGANKAANEHFNFLWWYPEVKFCELDPQLVPLP